MSIQADKPAKKIKVAKPSKEPSAGVKKMKDAFSSPWASFAAIVIAIFWTIPTFGLLVSSFRPELDINNSGWWTFFLSPNVTL